MSAYWDKMLLYCWTYCRANCWSELISGVPNILRRSAPPRAKTSSWTLSAGSCLSKNKQKKSKKLEAAEIFGFFSQSKEKNFQGFFFLCEMSVLEHLRVTPLPEVLLQLCVAFLAAFDVVGSPFASLGEKEWVVCVQNALPFCVVLRSSSCDRILYEHGGERIISVDELRGELKGHIRRHCAYEYLDLDRGIANPWPIIEPVQVRDAAGCWKCLNLYFIVPTVFLGNDWLVTDVRGDNTTVLLRRFPEVTHRSQLSQFLRLASHPPSRILTLCTWNGAVIAGCEDGTVSMWPNAESSALRYQCACQGKRTTGCTFPGFRVFASHQEPVEFVGSLSRHRLLSSSQRSICVHTEHGIETQIAWVHEEPLEHAWELLDGQVFLVDRKGHCFLLNHLAQAEEAETHESRKISALGKKEYATVLDDGRAVTVDARGVIRVHATK